MSQFVGGVDLTTLPQLNSDTRARKSNHSSAPPARKSRQRSPDGDLNKQQSNFKKTSENSDKPQLKNQRARWASPRHEQQQQQQEAAGNRPPPTSPVSTKDDVTDEPGPPSQDQHPQQPAADKVPAESTSDNDDAAQPDDDDEEEKKSQEPDGMVTKNGYIRVTKVVGK